MADRMSIDSKPRTASAGTSNGSSNHGHGNGHDIRNGNPTSHHHESHRDDYSESVGSSPEGDDQLSSLPAAGATSQDAQQPKRKGGRKPIYATSEERKQRNRQAQAAFRERRTEYIKQLEETIRVHESNLHNLQTAHRTAADECLMLRYKNSLLERILLEKGIDVQAELRAKTGSPNLGPTHMPQNLVQPPPIQRAIMNRHHQSRRSTSSIVPKGEPGSTLPPPIQQRPAAASPKNRPTPPSHSNSPSNAGSAFSPAASENLSMRASVASASRPHMAPMPAAAQPARSSMMQPNHGARAPPTSSGASFYPTPAFQNHVEQLEQEYDAQTDMVDDAEMEAPSGPGPYPTTFNGGPQQPVMLSPASNGPSHHVQHAQEHMQQGQVSNQQYPSMTQLLDQNLDWDPFGLSASMAFPTQQFQFDQVNMR